MAINQDPATPHSEVLLEDGNDQGPIPGTLNHSETGITNIQNPSESRDIHVSGVAPEEVQPSAANVRVESTLRRSRGRSPKRNRGRAGS